MPCLIPPSTVNIVEHLYDKVGFKTYLAMDINYDVGYRLKGSSPWWAAKSTVGVITAVAELRRNCMFQNPSSGGTVCFKIRAQEELYVSKS